MINCFDTNYRYIVLAFTAATQFSPEPPRLAQQLAHARACG
jgi:hypothetical protein